jgi:phenylacetate-CoA ligase
MLPPLSPWLIRNVIYPLYRGVRGDNVLEYLDELEANQWLKPAELEGLRWRKLEELLGDVTKYVPYYVKLFRNNGIEAGDIRSPSDLNKIPFLTREKIYKAGSDLITRDPFRRRSLSAAAGSAAGTVRFFCDIRASAIRRANFLRAGRWANADLGEREVRFCEVSLGGTLNERVMWRLKNYFNNVYTFSTLDMSEKSMREYTSALRRLKPGYISGYPSALVAFVDFVKGNSLKVSRPGSVITNGGKLYPQQRSIIEGFFQCPVYERYGCEEFASLAQECEEHNGLHVFSDIFLVEVIHESGRPARRGEIGELVVTDLYNRYMPLLRYRTGDMARPAERACPCGRGFQLLDGIEGPSMDSVITPEGRKVARFFWTGLLNAVPGVGNFQIEQRESDGIILKVLPGEEWRDEYRKLLETKIKENCGESFKVDFIRVDDIPPAASGKYRLIVSNMQERLLVKTKIHKATITGADPDDFDSLSIDPELMRYGNLTAGEKVLIVDNTNGARVETTVRESKKKSGDIVVAGAASRHIHAGDEVSIMAFTWAQGINGKFSNILVDKDNRFVRYLTDKDRGKI